MNIVTYPFDGFQSILDDGTYDVMVNKGNSVENDMKVITHIRNALYKYANVNLMRFVLLSQ